MIGGMVTSTLLTLIVIPVLYHLWRGRQVAMESTPESEAP
jgi:Cu(I)/Ag(I) efflux system membrane protein CusA/SilA